MGPGCWNGGPSLISIISGHRKESCREICRYFHDLIHNLPLCITGIAMVSGCFCNFINGTVAGRLKIKSDT